MPIRFNQTAAKRFNDRPTTGAEKRATCGLRKAIVTRAGFQADVFRNRAGR